MTFESENALVIRMFGLPICHSIGGTVTVVKAIILNRGLYA
jgi:hypothetical protein